MSGDYIPGPDEPLTPGALRTIANWLDTYDQMAERYWQILEANGIGDPEQLAAAREATARKDMQNDLRRWANEMDQR